MRNLDPLDDRDTTTSTPSRKLEPPHHEVRALHPKWLREGALALGVAVLAAGLTYAAVVFDWAPAVTGSFYTESEYEDGIETAFEDGEVTGREAGFAAGEQVGFANGEDAGYDQGYSVGVDEGYATGTNEGYGAGYDVGYGVGEADGYVDGLNDGYTTGCLSLFTGLGTDRVGDWWDYYYSSYYGSYYTKEAC